MAGNDKTILALNSGSSSLKFGLFTEDNRGVQPAYRGAIEDIGGKEGRLRLRGADGQSVRDEPQRSSTQAEAMRALVALLSRLEFPPPAAIGHRIVHGGPALREHQRITPSVLRQLESAAPFAPLHVPAALSLIRETQLHYPAAAQFACFDTAFHRTLPEAAARFPLPEKFWASGIRRYGFHGISCESILHALSPDVPPRVIVAHLGNGASIIAIADGLSVDTTMGLTPTGGIIMGTRTGDLDPGALLHILRTTRADLDALEHLLDKQSGLLGISGISADMRELHRAATDPRAHLAIEMFSRSAKKAIGGFAAILGGVDLLVFTGGIGEHDPIVRSKICSSLAFLAIAIDPNANAQNLRTISRAESRVRVLVIPSDEEAQIARHVFRLLRQSSSPAQSA